MLPLGVLAASGAAAVKYFITKVTGASSSSTGNGVFIDSSDNILWAFSESASPYYSQYTTIDRTITYGTSTRWTNSTGSPRIWSIRGTANSRYLVTFPDNLSSSSEILKTNTAGTKQWSRSFTLSGTSGGEIALDSSENVYLVTKASQNGTGNNKFTVAKYNSSGTIQWQKAIQGESNCNGWAIAVTPSGDVYAGGSLSSNTTPQLNVMKLNTSGTKQWALWIANGGYQIQQLVTDADGNCYIMWNDGTYTYVSKANSSGTHQWTRRLTVGNGYDMAIDPSNNLYIIAGSYTAVHYVFKYNSSGTIQWQRSIVSSSGFMYGLQGVSKIFANDKSVIWTLQETGNADPVLFKFPTDGTLTGTYAMGGYNYTWAASSITETSASFTWYDFTAYYNANSGTATDASGAVSPSTWTPTTTTKEIP